MSENTEIQQILEIVQFMQENMATKDDIAQVRSEMATKDEMREMESRLMEHIDGFAQQNQKFDQELVAAQAKFNRIEERVEVLEFKAGVAVKV